MPTVSIIHWRPEEAAELVAAVEAAGFTPRLIEDPYGGGMARGLRAGAPDAIVLDLSRLPAHGREVGIWLRNQKWSRDLPLIFTNGLPEKLAPIQEKLPDAVYTTTKKLGAALKKALKPAKKNAAPVVPQLGERWSERTTAQKLGIRAGMAVGVVDPPRGYASAIGVLPEGAEFIEMASDDLPSETCPLTAWFLHNAEALVAALPGIRRIAPKTKLWIIWPKGSQDGLTGNSVRETLLDLGLVDYKICAVDAKWSAMAFAVRKTPR